MVDSLKTVRKTYFRQPNNKSATTFVKDIKESFGTAIEVGGTDTSSLAAMQEAISNGVGNSMTLSQYFDDNLTTNVHVWNKNASESYKQRLLARMIVLNYKHKSAKNNIQYKHSAKTA